MGIPDGGFLEEIEIDQVGERILVHIDNEDQVFIEYPESTIPFPQPSLKNLADNLRSLYSNFDKKH